MVPVGDTVKVPLVAFVPLQPPPAVHASAFVVDQLTVETFPETMLVGLAENVIVGAVYSDWASATGENANVKASAPASGSRALRSEETKAKLKVSPPNQQLLQL